MRDTNDEYSDPENVGLDEQREEKREQQEIKRSWLWNLLDKLEDIEIRMIYGIFRFIFVKIPFFIKDILVEWFPTFLKFLKVVLLLSVWIMIILVPVIFWEYSNFRNSINSLRDWLSAIRSLPQMIPTLPITYYIWSILAISGSLWGIVYIRRNKNMRFFKQFKSIFRRPKK